MFSSWNACARSRRASNTHVSDDRVLLQNRLRHLCARLLGTIPHLALFFAAELFADPSPATSCLCRHPSRPTATTAESTANQDYSASGPTFAASSRTLWSCPNCAIVSCLVPQASVWKSLKKNREGCTKLTRRCNAYEATCWPIVKRRLVNCGGVPQYQQRDKRLPWGAELPWPLLIAIA